MEEKWLYNEIDCFVVVVGFVDGGQEGMKGGFIYLVMPQWSRLFAVTKRS